ADDEERNQQQGRHRQRGLDAGRATVPNRSIELADASHGPPWGRKRSSVADDSADTVKVGKKGNTLTTVADADTVTTSPELEPLTDEPLSRLPADPSIRV